MPYAPEAGKKRNKSEFESAMLCRFPHLAFLFLLLCEWWQDQMYRYTEWLGLGSNTEALLQGSGSWGSLTCYLMKRVLSRYKGRGKVWGRALVSTLIGLTHRQLWHAQFICVQRHLDASQDATIWELQYKLQFCLPAVMDWSAQKLWVQIAWLACADSVCGCRDTGMKVTDIQDTFKTI